MKKNKMIAFEQAIEMIMDLVKPLDTERVDIDKSLNRILAEDVVSDIEMPPFDKSAMDGFACRRADLANKLTIIETIPTGYVPKKNISVDKCAKIMTGAVVPEGADCVIMVEHTELISDNQIRFTGESTADNICSRAEDVKKGEVVLAKGIKIKSQQIAVLAAVGCTKPLVSCQPKIGIIATGDELVEPDIKPSFSQIRNSNASQLSAQISNIGISPIYYGIALDEEKAINSMLKKAISETNVILLSGGVSMGDFDFVPKVLCQNNIKLAFEKIAIKPGKPTVFGFSEETFFFGMPGNPVSTLVIFEIMVKPFLYKMMGHEFKPLIIQKRLSQAIYRKKTKRISCIPVTFAENGKIKPIEYHGSGHIKAMCDADGIIEIPVGVSEIKEGTIVDVRQI
ncbi:MAG: molybdopterin molybdotransferase MoeA [Planctomycetota bacterium]|jgi:molybdopterin molybdotransferase